MLFAIEKDICGDENGCKLYTVTNMLFRNDLLEKECWKIFNFGASLSLIGKSILTGNEWHGEINQLLLTMFFF